MKAMFKDLQYPLSMGVTIREDQALIRIRDHIQPWGARIQRDPELLHPQRFFHALKMAGFASGASGAGLMGSFDFGLIALDVRAGPFPKSGSVKSPKHNDLSASS